MVFKVWTRFVIYQRLITSSPQKLFWIKLCKLRNGSWIASEKYVLFLISEESKLFEYWKTIFKNLDWENKGVKIDGENQNYLKLKSVLQELVTENKGLAYASNAIILVNRKEAGRNSCCTNKMLELQRNNKE